MSARKHNTRISLFNPVIPISKERNKIKFNISEAKISKTLKLKRNLSALTTPNLPLNLFPQAIGVNFVEKSGIATQKDTLKLAHHQIPAHYQKR
jgi:hypothetical protein